MHDKPVAAGKSSFDLIDSKELFSVLRPHEGEIVLDLACGIGNYSVELARLVGTQGVVYAVDVWKEGLVALNERCKKEMIRNVRTAVVDLRASLPFEDESMDIGLMATILHDLPRKNQDTLNQEVARVLRPGGMLSVIEFQDIAIGPGPPPGIRMSADEVIHRVTAHGLLEEYRGTIGPYNYLVNFRKPQ